jgi:hypothetical protein
VQRKRLLAVAAADVVSGSLKGGAGARRAPQQKGARQTENPIFLSYYSQPVSEAICLAKLEATHAALQVPQCVFSDMHHALKSSTVFDVRYLDGGAHVQKKL